MSDPRDQPYLHDLVTVLRAPLVALGGRDGQLRADGVQGVYAYDRRLLSALVVTVDGQEPECLSSHLESSASLRTAAVIRGAGDRQPDPTVLLHRGRDVEAHGVVESLRFTSRAHQSVCLQVSVAVAADLADLDREINAANVRAVGEAPDLREAHAMQREQEEFIARRNAQFGRPGYDLQKAMKARLQRLNGVDGY